MRDVAFWEDRLKHHTEILAHLKPVSPVYPMVKGMTPQGIKTWQHRAKEHREYQRALKKHQTAIAYCQERIRVLTHQTHWDHLRKGLGICGA